ncbi:MAG: choice-of-anchor U domain-containing protein [Thermodesulfobacteriota bacterium]
MDEHANESIDSNEVCNYRPVLSYPANTMTDIVLSPEMETLHHSDERYPAFHAATVWQISTAFDFTPESIVFESRTGLYLYNVSLPDLILDPEKVYYWRVRHVDHYRSVSPWSLPFSFTTTAYSDEKDDNGNGIPDHQELLYGLDDTIDLDQNGIGDIKQNDIWVVRATNPAGYIGLTIKNFPEQLKLDFRFLKTIDLPLPTDLAGVVPNRFLSGIVFKSLIDPPGSMVAVDIVISKIDMAEPIWYHRDPDSGWRHSEAASFDDPAATFSLQIQDGGEGDDDGTANGSITHTGGFSPRRIAPPAGDDRDGGPCFVNSIPWNR